MRQNFRPYSMAIHAPDGSVETSATLRDSAGNIMACNYVSVSCSGAANRALHRVSFDPTGITTPHVHSQSFTDSVGTTTSALPCLTTSVAAPPAVFITSDSDRISEVFMQAYSAGTGANELTYIIQYGQISVGNNLRDQERPIGD